MATKKNAKTAAQHIDKRETFVSIQQSISDNDMSMEDKLRTLYEIQKTDSKIDQIDLLRGELPEEVKDIEDEIEGLNTRISHLKEDIQTQDKVVDSYKKAIEESKAKSAKYEEQQKNVQNNREFESLNKELEFQDLERQSLDKKIHESTAIIADWKASLDDTKTNLAGRKTDLINKNKELATITEETSKEKAALQKHVDELSAQLDERMISAYHRVRDNAKNRLAVVTVKREACGGCFNKIPPQKRIEIEQSKKIIVCDYCGRILVSSSFEKDEPADEKNAK
ncbi:MAG: C4-type zinc ribbon domain-containing protein [Bacteroidales bacterium]|jgi:predicted  nucleic acid-binding Zn-ribbon protein|nr:C4-type zinc ribbon domain-containing protein [Bacteroidales bacterium]MCI2122481.1 C4-type zinc ribbon domain-containing protein [Bacteroidales bacterium]MCI2146253.1 C4-type zinc ribbon domain-containing protein [Bacteroidales bacterium]